MAFLFDHPFWSNLDCVGSWAAGNVFHHWWGWHIRGTLLQEENIKRVASIFWIEKSQVGLVVPCSVQLFLLIKSSKPAENFAGVYALFYSFSRPFWKLWIIDRPGHTKNSLVVNFSIHSGLYFLSHKSFNPYLVILNYYLLVYSCTQKWERKRMEGSRTPPCLFSWPPSCGIVSIDLWFPRHNTK